MKTVRQLCVVAVLAMPLLLQAQAASKITVRELTLLKDQRLKAEFDRNTSFLQHVLADELIYGMTQGDVLNKAQLLERTSAPEHTYEELRSDHVLVRIYGNVAIMTDRTTARGVNYGRPFAGLFRFVRIFVRKEGRWQVVLEQGTPMQSASIPSK